MQSFFLWLLVIFSAGATMYFMTLGVFYLFRKYNIVDKPHLYPHEKHRAPLPYPGGVVLILNILLWSPWIVYAVGDADIKKVTYVVIAGLLTTIVMAWDDQRRTIPPLFRLIFQISLGVFFGMTAIKIGYLSNIFGGIIYLDQFNLLQYTVWGKTIYILPIIVTVMWYILVMNAINWSDNGKAMTSSVSLVTCIILAFLAIKLYLTDSSFAAQGNSIFVLSFLTILIPTIFVFWIFDIKRACII